MIYPTTDVVLTSIIDAVETDIAPHVHDDYAASLCKTVAQMLRSVRVRASEEVSALHAGNNELRSILTAALDRADHPAEVHSAITAAVTCAPPPQHPELAELHRDAIRLRAALTAVIDATPDESHPSRQAAREYLRHQLEREQCWQQDAFTGPRR
ncbi:MAG: hypothetical protein EOP32_01355 [Rhodococcus sp. (in: high G+C Gram-positive bacteria)]|nr:MAG: hypothetical protein EOP32_01355 [Rhodococcus sp. (in: high G+C Gram-positive bacteria)]